MKHFHGTTVRARGGFAVLSVLFVLLAVLVLCVPFLMTARSSNKVSTQAADRAQVRIALDSAVRHARAGLGESHPARDATPYFDDEEELKVDSALAPEFWNNHDPHGVMWDVEAVDVAGRIDIGSAPPQLFANLLGAVTRLSDPLKAKDKTIKVVMTRGFEPEGFLWIDSELVRYTQLVDGGFGGLTRGLSANVDEDGNWTGCGPSPAADHDINTVVVDQRAFAIPEWRIADASTGLRTFDSIEQLLEADPLVLAGSLGRDLMERLEHDASVYGGVRAGPQWHRAVRVTNSLQANESCVVRVAERRNFNPGTTVMITDGRLIEFGIVLDTPDGDGLRLRHPVRVDYQGYRAVIAPLARRPVNVNVASATVLEVLFTNLQLRGRSSRITSQEAQRLAALCLESRPFTGLEDFLRRVVLPAAGVENLPKDAPVVPAVLASAGGNIIDVDDGIALYANALNANDDRLAYSTLPLAFVSRDVYALHARSAVNAPSGIVRSTLVREEVALIVPQSELLGLWARQEDFEEALRLFVDTPWWCTGPNATSRFDPGSPASQPPSRLYAHWGTWNDAPFVPGQTPVAPDEQPSPEHVFPSRDETGWTQLAPSRVEETSFLQGRMVHFDHETRDLEGRYLPDQQLTYAPQDKQVQWTPATGGLARGLTKSFWIKPRQIGDGTFLDYGTGALDTDRVWLGIEGPDLVLRVIDGPGDHPSTPLREHGEARFEFAPGVGPGLLQDTWSHVEIDVRGNRPDQIQLAVDGRQFGVRTPGLTKLAASFGSGQMVFLVENGEGFPDRGVARIGGELVEYVRQNATSFVARFDDTGPHAGFGGRLARNQFSLSQNGGVEPGVNLATGAINDSHTVGTPVEVYGYSLGLTSDAPAGEGTLFEDVGRFAVGYVAAVEVNGQTHPGEPIAIAGFFFPIGLGMEGFNSQVTALQLVPADPAPMTTQTMMAGFQKSGGYALVMQLGPATNNNQQPVPTLAGSPLWGTEVIQYSGVDNDKLLIRQRAALPSENSDTDPHAFIVDWQVTINGTDPDTELDRKIFVVPISINAGANPGSFLPPLATAGSEFAQITELAAAERTEWVRYDRILNGHLVRSDPVALGYCREQVIGAPRGNTNPPPPPPPDSGPPEGPPAAAPPPPPASPAPPAAPLGPQNPPGYNASAWVPVLGVDEDLNAPVTRTARTALQFRGVFGTYAHAHARNTRVHPVWRVEQSDVNRGHPGHGDSAFLVEGNPTTPGWPIDVHRAYRPREYLEASWTVSSNPMQPQKGNDSVAPETGMASGIYVAANAALRVPIVLAAAPAGLTQVEMRLRARLSKFPSGERPRDATRIEIGRALDGSGIPSAVIDEIAFGNDRFGEGTVHADALQGAQLTLTSDFPVGGTGFTTFPKVVRSAYGLVGDTKIFLDDLPQDAGLLRIGSEIVCYDLVDSANGAITIANGGRALLGTEEEAHEAGEEATWLETRVVTTLAAPVTAGAAVLPLEDAAEFPSQGTVLIGGELIHYTHLAGTLLEMPRGSTVPGAMDGNGAGIFRGRFGTAAAGHGAGEPVILFPIRYWDRWADRADAPELAYFGLSIDQPNAYWIGSFFQVEEPPGSKVEVLQRTNPLVPWDMEPDPDPRSGLARLEQGMKQGRSLPIGVQRDFVEWRAYVRYAPNAFDATAGLSHGWKRTPRMTMLGVEYLGPGLTLRRVDE